MALKVKFCVTADKPVNRDAVRINLEETFQEKNEKVWTSNDPRNIWYETTFSDKDTALALNRINEIYGQAHVEKVAAYPNQKFTWDNIIPMLISAIISFLTIFALLLGLEVKLGLNEYIASLFIPTIVGFWQEALHRKF